MPSAKSSGNLDKMSTRIRGKSERSTRQALYRCASARLRHNECGAARCGKQATSLQHEARRSETTLRPIRLKRHARRIINRMRSVPHNTLGANVRRSNACTRRAICMRIGTCVLHGVMRSGLPQRVSPVESSCGHASPVRLRCLDHAHFTHPRRTWSSLKPPGLYVKCFERG